MMRLLIDCDVLLDVMLRREPHFEASAALLDWAEAHPGRTAVAWHTAANLIYLAGSGAEAFLTDLLSFAEVPPTGTESFRFALSLGMPDLEDAMQVAAAARFQAQLIITRSLPDYRRSPIQAVPPTRALTLLGV